MVRSESVRTCVTFVVCYRVEQPKIRSYRDLIVWQKAMRLVVATYAVAQKLPRSKDHGLGGQMRRAASSVASNIAEGHGRDHLGDYLRHLSFAKGSLTELETQLLTAGEIAPALRKDIDPLLALCEEVGRMLSVLSRKLRLKLEAKPRSSSHPAPSTQHLAPDPTVAPQRKSGFGSLPPP
jgi:four helix bundle protein